MGREQGMAEPQSTTPSFEQAMARLEKIVEAIEQGRISLEDAIKQYEEGMALIRQCRDVLAGAELKIQQLQAQGADRAGPAAG